MDKMIKFRHLDLRLQAKLLFEESGAVWVIEYYRDGKLVCSSLYLSMATAILVLDSLGYTEDQREAV